jgi:hypothetical protein
MKQAITIEVVQRIIDETNRDLAMLKNRAKAKAEFSSNSELLSANFGSKTEQGLLGSQVTESLLEELCSCKCAST